MSSVTTAALEVMLCNTDYRFLGFHKGHFVSATDAKSTDFWDEWDVYKLKSATENSVFVS